ncbi:MAG TPA: hypothetical protein PLB45_04025 [Bacilli bacterium]|jgi:hypothetical protein|nr:hypothetical protein [Bacilli bacterium]HPZ24157.1 hypothetical protein [Bacilli bacterium]HQC84019.1 hypothetical protein [Bacilli bacterium]
MRTYKKNLPDGVKKAFGLDRGVKVRLINKKMADAKKKKELAKKAAKAA